MPPGMMGMGMGMGGAASGAASGSMLGPIGALAGAGTGMVSSAMDDREAKKEKKRQEEQTIGKHRKLRRITDAIEEANMKRMMGMAGLSQAALDWAQLIR